MRRTLIDYADDLLEGLIYLTLIGASVIAILAIIWFVVAGLQAVSRSARINETVAATVTLKDLKTIESRVNKLEKTAVNAELTIRKLKEVSDHSDLRDDINKLRFNILDLYERSPLKRKQ